MKATPAKVKFLSCEPLLDWINLKLEGIDWVIVGAESGPRRRVCYFENMEHIIKQCRKAGVPVFVKQIQQNGKVVKDFDKFPAWAKIREFPKTD